MVDSFSGDLNMRALYLLGEVMGDKWTQPILGLLASRPMRFNEIKRVANVHQDTLGRTLEHLVKAGLIVREEHPGRPPTVIYGMTNLGLSMIELARIISDWFREHPDLEKALRDYVIPDPRKWPFSSELAERLGRDGINWEVIRLLAEAVREKWSLPVVGLLLDGPKHFNELLNALGVHHELLTSALRHMARCHLIAREAGDGTPVSVVYQLTDFTINLLPLAVVVTEWVRSHPGVEEAFRPIITTDQRRWPF